MEDDVVPSYTDWLDRIENWMNKFIGLDEKFGSVVLAHTWVPEEQRWDRYYVNINGLFNGFFALLMPTEIAKNLSRYFYDNFLEFPVDTLFGLYMQTFGLPVFNIRQSLFEHVGISSTKDKIVDFESKVLAGNFSSLPLMRWADCEFIPLISGSHGVNVITMNESVHVSLLETSSNSTTRVSFTPKVFQIIGKIKQSIEQMVSLVIHFLKIVHSRRI